MYIIMKKVENSVDKPYGLCSCGETFAIQPRASKLTKCTIACPHCGAMYGNSWSGFYKWPYDKWNDEDQQLGHYTKKAMLRIEHGEDEQVIIYRELPNFDKSNLIKLIVKTRSKIWIGTKNGLKIEKIEIDGKEWVVNKSNIAKALSYSTIEQIRDAEKDVSGPVQRFLDVAIWTAKALRTTSMSTIICSLFEYPVAESLFDLNTQQPDKGYEYMAFLQYGTEIRAIKPYVSSVKKALNLSKDLIPLALDLVLPLNDIQDLQKEYGPDLARIAISDAYEILKKRDQNSYMLSLSKFLATRTPAERQRLKKYLTEEVAIYQGIEDPGKAWNILSDYIRMSEEMEVEYSLCPKSLKLRHDLAARNYKLVLDEIEKRKFREAVARPNYKGLEWVSADQKWAVLIPKEPEDMIQEGIKQSHCVGSYVKFVLSGEYRICFLRKTEDLDKPVLTLTVTKNDVCSMYLGFDNRDATKEEVSILKEWTKAKNLKLR